LKEFFQTHYNLEIEEVELGVKGWNWGKAEVQGPSLAFWIGDKKTFEVPLSDVVNANMPTKNEVSLEFSSEERARGENNPLSSPGNKRNTRNKKRNNQFSFFFFFFLLLHAEGMELSEIKFVIPSVGKTGEDDENGGEEKVNEDDEDGENAFLTPAEV